MPVTVYGIRHHGPGCARGLRAALERLQPEIVLVEGPPDAQEVLALLLDGEMQPPVALLVYVPERPQQAAFYPFTVFSPEWQALRYALERGIPARFMDLPQAIHMAIQPPAMLVQEETPIDRESTGAPPVAEAPPDLPAEPTPEDLLRDDPIALLSQAVGYADRELWWEHQVEQRRDAEGLFEGILEAMTALRAESGPPRKEEALREAHMRQTIRAAQKEGFTRIAVVCGAWHAPVLAEPGPAAPDAALLKGLPRVPVTATWIPWTNSRLSSRSGYGAGIVSPGWYEHLWRAPKRSTILWVTHAARLLREAGLDASSASVIEAVRLAEALAAMRDLSMPGLADLHEAIQTVLCGGEPAPMVLIRDKLEIGERLGEVPSGVPTVPLAQDLAQRQRRLRLKPEAEVRTLDLDLRTETDLGRSHLLHRLRLLEIAWGTPQRSSSRTSTFHEIWQIAWRPELALDLVEANVWGNTIEAASAARVRHDADAAGDLPALTALLDNAILAALLDAVDHVLVCVQARAAVSADLRHLMDALPALARVARYGDVRQTRVEHILPIIDGLFERVVAGLAPACASLDDDAAEAMSTSIANVRESLGLLDHAEHRDEWYSVLRSLIERDTIHGLVRGWACRLLLESHVLNDADLQRLARLALSPVTPAPQAAAWVSGVLRGSGLLLLHQEGLWRALNVWLNDLDAGTFTGVLPLLRRAFSGFQPPERRKMGELVKDLGQAGGRAAFSAAGQDADLDHARAAQVLPVLAQILGVSSDAIEKGA